MSLAFQFVNSGKLNFGGEALLMLLDSVKKSLFYLATDLFYFAKIVLRKTL